MDFRRLDKERYGLAGLIVVFLICTAFIMSRPHSLENATVPDEMSYYGWAKLYNEGFYHVPLYDWFGVLAGFDYHVNASGLFYLKIQERSFAGSEGAENLEILVTMQDDSPVAGANVHLAAQKPRIDVSGFTNASGAALFSNVPATTMAVSAQFSTPPFGSEPAVNLGVFDFYDNGGMGEPYQAKINFLNFTQNGIGYDLQLHVVDSLDHPVPNAILSHIVKGPGQAQPQPIGSTDADGGFVFSSMQDGSQVLTARKDSKRGIVPVASVVPYGDGYVAVNHWAPGYSVYLGILDRGGLAEFGGIMMMAVALAAAYPLARRLFGWRVAFVSAILLLTCGVALLLIWTSGMADYASMAFGLVGIWLLTEAIWAKRPWFISWPIGLLGGIAFGVGVCMRYSTASLLLAVAFLVFAMSYKDWKNLKGQTRFAFQLLKRFLIRSLPFTIGLMLLLIPLAMYNASYFGGPLGASHNYGGQISIDGGNGNVTANVVIGNVYSNFDPVDSIPTMAVRIHWLLTVMPFLLLVPVALHIGWRRLSVLFLVSWLLSNLLLYLFVPWVASWWEAARAMEDTRYFLPALPPAAILGGLVITEVLLIPKKRRILGIVVLALLIAAGFAAASVGIGAQIDRLGAPPPGGGPGPTGPPTPPPVQPNYTLLTVRQLVGGPGVYSDKLVEVRNCTFDHWINSVSFLFRDASSPVLLKVDLISGYTPPALSTGTIFNLKGVFHWVDGNGDSIPQIQELSISVKAGTKDSIVLV